MFSRDLQIKNFCFPKVLEILILVITCFQPLCQKQENKFHSGENDLQYEGKQVMNIFFFKKALFLLSSDAVQSE